MKLLISLYTGEYILAETLASHYREATESEQAAWKAAQEAGELAEQQKAQTIQQLKADARALALINNLKSLTADEIEAYVDTAVTDLASAKNLFVRIGIILAVLVRRGF